MIGLFLRLFILLGTSTILVLLGVRFFLEVHEDEVGETLLSGHAALIASQIAETPPVERRDFAEQLSSRLGQRIKLEPTTGLRAPEAQWRDGRVYVVAPVPDSEGQIALGPLPAGNIANLYEAIVLALLVSASASLLITWPVSRRIRSLEHLAKRMCAGDFSARIHREESDALDGIGGALNTLADRIGQLLHDERDLLRTVAHEVRAPIARMRFRVEKIFRKADEDAQNEGARLVSDLAQVDRLFEELLTYVAFDEFDQEGPDLTTTKIDVAASVSRVIAEVTDVSEEIEVELLVRENGEIDANEKLFERAVTNLLLNAMAYGGPRIWVEIRGFESDLIVDVQDSGPGVREADRLEVIKPFVRRSTKKTKGTGLGLAIVSRVMRVHGGRLHILDAPRGGASIQLVWPTGPLRGRESAESQGLVRVGAAGEDG